MKHDGYFNYDFSVQTDELEHAIAKVASILYLLVEEGLSAHEDHEAEECEFEEFARDIMGVLTRHADQLVVTTAEDGDAKGGEDEAVR